MLVNSLLCAFLDVFNEIRALRSVRAIFKSTRALQNYIPELPDMLPILPASTLVFPRLLALSIPDLPAAFTNRSFLFLFITSYAPLSQQGLFFSLTQFR
jgi:hypothetical protein